MARRRPALIAALTASLCLPVALVATSSDASQPAHESAPTRTAYPGGRWEPGHPRFGVAAKKTVKVRMSDGVKLTVDLYYPADLGTGARAKRSFPVIVQQTPYTNSTGTAGAVEGDAPGELLVTHGYIYASADVRGTGRSGGNGGYFSRRDALDGVDLVHWAAHVDGSNGDVGLDGCSYLAQAQLYTAAQLGRHSPVKAMIPLCVSGDVYRDTYFENGIPSIAWHGAGVASGSLLGPTIEKYLATKYADSQAGGDTGFYKHFWRIRDHIAQAKAIVRTHIPALLWVGWDEPGFGDFELYAALQNAWAGRSPYAKMRLHQRVTGRYQLILGNWSHGGGLDPALELQWFDRWIKHKRTGLQTHTQTPIHMQELPSKRWVNASTYPMTNRYRRLFLAPSSRLAADRPHASTGSLDYGPPDPGNALTFTSPRFRKGATIAGPLTARIVATSSTRNLELMVDVYDVAPDGTATQVSHGGVLGSLHTRVAHRSWRDRAGRLIRPFFTLQRDVTIPAGTRHRYDVPIQPAFWSLAPKHRLRIVLASQPDPSVCMSNGAKVVAKVIGCLPRPAILAQLAGGAYTIGYGGRHPSTLNVPLLPYGAFVTTRSGVTPTSNGVRLPLDWSSPR